MSASASGKRAGSSPLTDDEHDKRVRGATPGDPSLGDSFLCGSDSDSTILNPDFLSSTGVDCDPSTMASQGGVQDSTEG